MRDDIDSVDFGKAAINRAARASDDLNLFNNGGGYRAEKIKISIVQFILGDAVDHQKRLALMNRDSTKRQPRDAENIQAEFEAGHMAQNIRQVSRPVMFDIIVCYDGDDGRRFFGGLFVLRGDDNLGFLPKKFERFVGVSERDRKSVV